MIYACFLRKGCAILYGGLIYRTKKIIRGIEYGISRRSGENERSGEKKVFYGADKTEKAREDTAGGN